MKVEEFIRLVNGKPWVNRACNFEAMDCWGLVVLYYRHVLGIELHDVAGYESGKDFVTCYSAESDFWADEPVARSGSIAVFYIGDQPDHVGLMLTPTKCLHASRASGFVRIDTPLNILKSHSKVEFKRYGAI